MTKRSLRSSFTSMGWTRLMSLSTPTLRSWTPEWRLVKPRVVQSGVVQTMRPGYRASFLT